MKMLKITFLLMGTIFYMLGCNDHTTGPEVITEPSTRSNYYIINQSDSDLNVTYTIAFIDKDSTIAVGAASTTKIFEAGGIGGDTPPSSAFDKLNFYMPSSDNMNSPLLTIEPVVNEDWNRTVEDGEARFELVLTKEDIQ